MGHKNPGKITKSFVSILAASAIVTTQIPANFSVDAANIDNKLTTNVGLLSEPDITRVTSGKNTKENVLISTSTTVPTTSSTTNSATTSTKSSATTSNTSTSADKAASSTSVTTTTPPNKQSKKASIFFTGTCYFYEQCKKYLHASGKYAIL